MTDGPGRRIPASVTKMTQVGRVYGGRSEAERRADRRRRLEDAGLALFGTVGWAGASIERLCQVAAVATRSFYEEYDTREHLLKAVYDRLVAEASRLCLDAVAQAPLDLEARTRAGVSTYVRFLTDDPRRALVVSSEARSTPLLKGDRAAALAGFAEHIQTETRTLRRRSGARERTLALALAGAVSEVLADWVQQPEPRPDVEPIVAELTRLFVAALTPAEELQEEQAG